MVTSVEKKKLKTWQIVLMVIGGLFLLGIIFGGGNSENKTSSDSNQDTIQTYNLNEAFVIDKFQYNFKKVQSTNYVGSEYFGEEASGEFLIFDLEVKNLGNEAEYINNEIYIIDEQEREFSQDDDTWAYLDDNFIFEELNPSLTKKGQIIFDVPEGINGKLCVKESMWSDSCEVYVSF
jgi:hypothetical protein